MRQRRQCFAHQPLAKTLVWQPSILHSLGICFPCAQQAGAVQNVAAAMGPLAPAHTFPHVPQFSQTWGPEGKLTATATSG